MNKGLSVLDTVKLIEGEDMIKDLQDKAIILGWCIEWLQAFFLVADDIMDDSPMRTVLKLYFRSKDYYIDLTELFHEVTYQTELGQIVDLITSPTSIIFYSFYMPVALALLLCGEKDNKNIFDISRDILVPMGVYFQVQDDYLDLYGDVALTGKVGTDIKDNK
ncbi:Farnesyl pyrophosphate synthase, partial [Smittium culicis]